jgi:1-acyl-sn-glycerol-3-phosphate acyltransferase
MREALTNPFCIAFTLAMSECAIGASVIDRSGASTRRVAKLWGETLCARCAVRVVARGVEQVEWERPLVVMANHQSHFDIPVLYAALPRVLGMLAKQELFRIPLFGRAMRSIGCVSIDRSDAAESRASLERAAQRVRTGSSIVVFPEGTRSTDGRVRELKKGPFYLAEAAGAPIVPVGIRGTRAVLPKHAKVVRPGEVELHVGAPILPETGASGRERTRLAVRDALVRLSGLPPA